MQGTAREYDQSTRYSPVVGEEEPEAIKPDDDVATQGTSGSPHQRLLIEEPSSIPGVQASSSLGRLKVRETLRLSFEFCILWVGSIPVIKEVH